MEKVKEVISEWGHSFSAEGISSRVLVRQGDRLHEAIMFLIIESPPNAATDVISCSIRNSLQQLPITMDYVAEPGG